jgi:hypothetical protein
MRELTDQEIDRLSGGVLNLGAGLFGAGISGLASGGAYAVNAATTGMPFSWSRLAGEAATGATTGFLLGTGATLMYAGFTGAVRGASVAGVSVAGAGGAFGAASAAGAGGQGGGSESS